MGGGRAAGASVSPPGLLGLSVYLTAGHKPLANHDITSVGCDQHFMNRIEQNRIESVSMHLKKLMFKTCCLKLLPSAWG